MLSVLATRARAPTPSPRGSAGGWALSAAWATGSEETAGADAAAGAADASAGLAIGCSATLAADSFATGVAPWVGRLGAAGCIDGTRLRGTEISIICEERSSPV